MKSVQLLALTLISCSLLLCSVQPEGGCDPEWFGPNCRYKCRCTLLKCGNDGRCTNGSRCLEGWFGPACQYVDAAYTMSSQTEVTDGDDDTCVESEDVHNVTIPLNITTTWFRVRFNVKGAFDTFTFEMLGIESSMACKGSSRSVVDNLTLDIHCLLDAFVQELVLLGEGIAHLCSVCVSGGRNVALKQTATQTSNYSLCSKWTNYKTYWFPADLAVDGNTKSLFLTDKTCSLTEGHSTVPQSWTVTLRPPCLVNRYILYNRSVLRFRLKGFRLESFNTTGALVYSHVDPGTAEPATYELTHAGMVVERVVITSGSTDNIVQLCELEIFGDSHCPPGHYGRECNGKCNCDLGDPCFVSSGGCTSGCTKGYIGEDCQAPCPPSKFGDDCQDTCSINCMPINGSSSRCNHSNGECLNGCVENFTGILCDAKKPIIVEFNFHSYTSSSTIAAAIVLAAASIMVIVVAGLFCVRRKTLYSESMFESFRTTISEGARSTDSFEQGLVLMEARS